MTLLSSALFFLFAYPAMAASAPRFAGLERLYFGRIPGRVSAHAEMAQSPNAKALEAMTPERLDPRDRHWEVSLEMPDGAMLSIRDFRVPGAGDLLLREVRDMSARLNDTWWVLYERGRRADAWHFRPDPQRTDHKLLPNWSIVSVAAPQPGRLAMRISGSMSRPAGAWWTSSADLSFSVAGQELRLEKVSPRYWAGRGYDRGEEPPIDVMTYTEADETVEVRTYSAVPKAVLHECAMRSGDQQPDEEVDDSGPMLFDEDVVRCITQRPEATTERRPKSAAFIERATAKP